MPPKIAPYNHRAILTQETSDLIDIIALTLYQNIQSNQKNAHHPLTVFCSAAIPQISINDYFKRCAKHLDFSEENFIYMMIYLQRYLNRVKTDFLHAYNLHRLSISVLLIVQKYICDTPFNNRSCAYIAGINIKELNQLEIEILAALNFDLNVNPKEYLQIKKYIVAIAIQEEKKCGKKYCLSFSQEDEAQLQQRLIDDRYICPEAVIITEESEPNSDTDLANAPKIAASMAASVSDVATAKNEPIQATLEQKKPSSLSRSFFSAPAKMTLEEYSKQERDKTKIKEHDYATEPQTSHYSSTSLGIRYTE